MSGSIEINGKENIVTGRQKTVIENWIKPPVMVRYDNSILENFDGKTLVCEFNFPEKYSGNPFHIDGKKVLDKGEMFRGRRTFYSDRFYALLEYYSEDGNLTAYYIDITLPAIVRENNVLILDLKIDFWIMPDRQRYLILDWNEFDDAVKNNLFTEKEILCCTRTVDFIKNCLENKRFDDIFVNYEKTSPDKWDRYKLFPDTGQ
jgi:predicted RNA-binding protein associated with RNAse of E/G family